MVIGSSFITERPYSTTRKAPRRKVLATKCVSHSLSAVEILSALLPELFCLQHLVALCLSRLVPSSLATATMIESQSAGVRGGVHSPAYGLPRDGSRQAEGRALLAYSTVNFAHMVCRVVAQGAGGEAQELLKTSLILRLKGSCGSAVGFVLGHAVAC